MTIAIRTENLRKRFRRIDALRGINLEVPEGAIYALVGPNGAGKTTAIKILMNIIAASEGRAEINGIDSTRVSGAPMQAIGYVSENQELPGWMRVDHFFAYLRPFYPRWDGKLESEILRRFDLPSDSKIRHLSRGTKMKVALASSLAYHPRVIVLDEPFGGLDPLVRDELIETILEHAAEATVFISSHDLAEIETFASHVGYLDQGTLHFSQEIGELSARFREVELTFASAPHLPGNLPQSWMHANASASVVRFIDSDFDQERSGSDIRRIFGDVRDLAFTPMSLRSIFLAMARAAAPRRKEGGQ